MITNDNISYCSDGSYDTTDDEASTISASSAKAENLTELVLSKEANQGKLAFGNIAVVNSSNVHFGNKTVYEGPVTIKQFLYPKQQTISDLNNGHNKLPDDNKTCVPDSVNNNKNINLGFNPSEKTINNKSNNNCNSNSPESVIKKDLKWLRNILRQHLPLMITLSGFLLLSLIILMSVLLTRHRTVIYSFDTNEQDQNSPTYAGINANFTTPRILKIEKRQRWLPRPSASPLKPLSKLVPYVIIMETETENCSLFSSCAFLIKNQQLIDINSLKKPDISYNFLIGGDGSAYEGVGWKYQGNHTSAYNNQSIGIAFIGTFSQTSPHQRQITATKQLIAFGVNEGYIDPNYKLLGNRQLQNFQDSQNTSDSGKLLFEEIKKWANWKEIL